MLIHFSFYFWKKFLWVNRIDPEQTLHSAAASDQGLHFLPRSQNLHARHNWIYSFIIGALSRENLSSGFPTRVDLNRPAQLQKLGGVIETRGIILSRQRTTKALTRLRGCAGWSARFLFPCGINRFSHDVAHHIPSVSLNSYDPFY